MNAIVLAGGLGTRLRDIVPDVPKAMASVAGRPFLEILLSDLARKGFARIVLALGFRADAVKRHFGERYAGMEIAYTLEGAPLGTGGAIRLAMARCSCDHVYIFNGDTFLNLEVDAVERLWQEQRLPIIVAREVDDTARYGRLLLAHERVVGLVEKGAGGAGFINAGCYVLRHGQLDAWPVNKPFSFEKDYLAHAVTVETLRAFKTRGLFIDIGVPEDYLRAQTVLAHHA